MLADLGAIVGAVIALGALLVSYRAHRHQVRRAEQLDGREREVEARERRAEERAKAAERQETLAQAAMVHLSVAPVASSLHPDWITPQVTVANLSSQPIRELLVCIAEIPVSDECGDVSSGQTRRISLPSTASRSTLGMLQLAVRIEFTDAAGLRWRKHSDGGLQEGQPAADGDWTWGARESPPVANAHPDIVDHLLPGPRYRRAGRAKLLVFLLVVCLVAASTVLLLIL
ncbi:hypothetical protein [Streptomyces sp. NPDC042319]|uniref:hypothetical protein n=1 Tax=Streptomyces sp. NPDC042319 TaxID=3154332 RepID=UPI0033E95A87